MRTMRERQMCHVYETIDKVIPKLRKAAELPEMAVRDYSYEDLKTLLVDANRVMYSTTAERYAAMVLSVARGATVDGDVHSWRIRD
jgi:hypothetical protein